MPQTRRRDMAEITDQRALLEAGICIYNVKYPARKALLRRVLAGNAALRLAAAHATMK